MKKSLSISFCAFSDVGMVRNENQDSSGKFPEENDDLTNPGGQLFIVADGMGGHRGGRKASQTAVEVISQHYFSNNNANIADSLKQAFEVANFRILQLSRSNPAFEGMGTTCSVLVLKNDMAWIAHIGDSRIYRINETQIEQLTQDHSQVAEMERQGIISKEEAQTHPQRFILNRALGATADVEVDIIEEIELRAEEYFLLCSDGLANIEDVEFQETVLSNSPQTACKILVDLANERGGHDNSTVQVIKID